MPDQPKQDHVNGTGRTLRDLLRDREAIRNTLRRAAELAQRRRALEDPGRARA